MQYKIVKQYDVMTLDSRHLTYQELYSLLQHGDVINTNSYRNDTSYFSTFRYFNYGLAHCALIIEEKGVKYIVHSHPNNYPIHKSNIKHVHKKDVFVSKWYVIKEPLLEFLITSQHSIYHIYTPPSGQKKIRVPESQLVARPIPALGTSIYYCTILIGDILVYNGCIPPSWRYFRFRTDELLSLLCEHGYNMTSVNC